MGTIIRAIVQMRKFVSEMLIDQRSHSYQSPSVSFSTLSCSILPLTLYILAVLAFCFFLFSKKKKKSQAQSTFYAAFIWNASPKFTKLLLAFYYISLPRNFLVHPI